MTTVGKKRWAVFQENESLSRHTGADLCCLNAGFSRSRVSQRAQLQRDTPCPAPTPPAALSEHKPKLKPSTLGRGQTLYFRNRQADRRSANASQITAEQI
ncbi:hypothetical protein Q8A67_019972 [Cirrhinus molitorella]|uniref:Uncharacterized protein n=1 Tax=Cirrhinus molitorella TaxID=172907 RepID=A0AA88PMK4_9TELE|nr:hypothetical protein Q8A67_019972 [Cirrhinus molitorella]